VLFDEIDETVSTSLADGALSLVGELARYTCLPATAVHRDLRNLFGFTVRLFRWVTPCFSADQKTARIDMSSQLLYMLA
jgi:hypothetical protein